MLGFCLLIVLGGWTLLSISGCGGRKGSQWCQLLRDCHTVPRTIFGMDRWDLELGLFFQRRDVEVGLRHEDYLRGFDELKEALHLKGQRRHLKNEHFIVSNLMTLP